MTYPNALNTRLVIIRTMPNRIRNTARECLNYLKWSAGIDFERVTLLYADRTLQEGSKVIEGTGIVEVQRRYFTTGDGGRLPLYKILEIRVDGRVIWRRKG